MNDCAKIWLYKMSVICRPRMGRETSAVCLRFCWRLCYCIPSFWAWVGLLWNWVVYMWALWLTLERQNSIFRDLSQGREKLVPRAYQDRIRAERRGERRRSARNSVWRGLHLGCNSQGLTPRKLGGHRGTGAYWKPPHLGLSAKPCISPGPELRIGRVGTFDRNMPSTSSSSSNRTTEVPGAPEPISTT